MAATIEYIESVIDTYRQATEANQRTVGREGNVIVLDAELADEVMVTADLHGHRKNFALIRRLADLDGHPRRHLVMQEVCHGGPTYPTNGGCMSHTMLEDIARLKARYPARFHFLLSNHELSEAMDYPILKGKKMLNLLFRLGMQEAYGAAAEKVRAAAMPFIRSCPLAVRVGGTFICHSLPEQCDIRGFDVGVLSRPYGPSDLKEHSDLFQLVWGRDFRSANAEAFAKKVSAKVLIHGHEPCPEGFHVPNDRQLILDCCGDKACYVMLPVGPDLSHAEVVKRVQPLA